MAPLAQPFTLVSYCFYIDVSEIYLMTINEGGRFSYYIRD